MYKQVTHSSSYTQTNSKLLLNPPAKVIGGFSNDIFAKALMSYLRPWGPPGEGSSRPLCILYYYCPPPVRCCILSQESLACIGIKPPSGSSFSRGEGGGEGGFVSSCKHHFIVLQHCLCVRTQVLHSV
jgi:hypothetical protein